MIRPPCAGGISLSKDLHHHLEDRRIEIRRLQSIICRVTPKAKRPQVVSALVWKADGEGPATWDQAPRLSPDKFLGLDPARHVHDMGSFRRAGILKCSFAAPWPRKHTVSCASLSGLTLMRRARPRDTRSLMRCCARRLLCCEMNSRGSASKGARKQVPEAPRRANLLHMRFWHHDHPICPLQGLVYCAFAKLPAQDTGCVRLCNKWTRRTILAHKIQSWRSLHIQCLSRQALFLHVCTQAQMLFTLFDIDSVDHS